MMVMVAMIDDSYDDKIDYDDNDYCYDNDDESYPNILHHLISNRTVV